MSETPASLDVVLGGATVLRLDSLDGDKPNLRVEISLETTGDASRDAFMSKFQDWFAGKSGGASGQGNATGIFTPVYRGMLEETAPSGTQHGSAEVAIKCARGVNAVHKLRYEAGLYQKELAPLQGTVVPRYHGFFAREIDDVQFGCLLLEWCAGGADWPLDRKASMMVMAAYRLHKAGVVHGNLAVKDAHHFLLHPDGQVRIIDFSTAQLHKCPGQHPVLYNEQPGTRPPGCEELYEVELNLGDISNGWSTLSHSAHLDESQPS